MLVHFIINIIVIQMNKVNSIKQIMLLQNFLDLLLLIFPILIKACFQIKLITQIVVIRNKKYLQINKKIKTQNSLCNYQDYYNYFAKDIIQIFKIIYDIKLIVEILMIQQHQLLIFWINSVQNQFNKIMKKQQNAQILQLNLYKVLVMKINKKQLTQSFQKYLKKYQKLKKIITQYKWENLIFKKVNRIQLKYKVMILVTSLLEQNSDSLVIKRVMRSLPLSTLKINLAIIYKRYKKTFKDQYTIDCFNNKNIKKEKLRQYTLITETGFYIYFLITYYLDLPSKISLKSGNKVIDQDLDIETKKELDDIQKNFIQKQVVFFFKKNIIQQQLIKGMFILQKNIIGQLWKFSNAILAGLYSYLTYIMKKFNKKNEQKYSKDDIINKFFNEGILFFKTNSASIEIVRDNQIEKVRFIKLPYCHYLPKETKVEFQNNVIRDSIHSKIQGIIDKYKNFIIICKHEEQLALFFNRNTFASIFANYVDMWRDIAFILTIILNAFIIISYSEFNNDRIWSPKLNDDTTVQQTKQLFKIFGYIMIFCSMLVLLFFLVKKGPLYLKEVWQTNEAFLQIKTGLIVQYVKHLLIIVSSLIRFIINPEVVYYLTYGTLAVLATEIHPFFFAFHLTEFLLRYPTLRNILRAVYEPYISLALTFILILLFIYFFSLFGYIFFDKAYHGRCQELYLCFFETFDQTFKNNGGLGGFYESNDPKQSNDYNYERFFIESFANISINLVIIQIFSGIIIDKFSQLRSEELEKIMDIQEMCFICGNTRELFDRKSDQGFVQHIKNEHYLWNYVFYLGFLQDKESTEYTGIESYVSEKLKSNDTSWFPIQRAAILVDEEKKIQMENNEFTDFQDEVFQQNQHLHFFQIQILLILFYNFNKKDKIAEKILNVYLRKFEHYQIIRIKCQNQYEEKRAQMSINNFNDQIYILYKLRHLNLQKLLIMTKKNISIIYNIENYLN
ncbi:hypothetical protein IMG5_185610 [Ichthyophthirius multifiliis]|uniref:MIR domain protein n=1 Tax=Ichthyophthirius multifiliis TaxID=5932 RepID=G0R3I9_ICHMU|nr:hypothetical protein IMG5_185610 [Ichthyophthirius multifiliis]EGR27978.1 hypothetical protein IMG5_185610 [Ichthyophthirius multifiliis]|eukprot:XP_004027323.1 hypothetical protein IMG5_185610 [Ichthyophthirius multifiliis]